MCQTIHPYIVEASALKTQLDAFDSIVAASEEFLQINDLSQIYELCINKNGVDGFGGFEMTFALSRIFFRDEEHIPIEISKELPDFSQVFQ